MLTDEFLAWYLSLDDSDRRTVAGMLDLLEANGLSLGYPYSSQIKGSKHALRELCKRGATPFRLSYAFDPERKAVVLTGGDKTGNDRFYEEMVPRADKIFDEYLAEQKAGLHDGNDD